MEFTIKNNFKLIQRGQNGPFVNSVLSPWHRWTTQGNQWMLWVQLWKYGGKHGPGMKNILNKAQSQELQKRSWMVLQCMQTSFLNCSIQGVLLLFYWDSKYWGNIWGRGRWGGKGATSALQQSRTWNQHRRETSQENDWERLKKIIKIQKTHIHLKWTSDLRGSNCSGEQSREKENPSG